MNTLQNPARQRQHIQHCFNFSPREPHTQAGRYIARRFTIDPRLADTVAALAGIGGAR